MQADAMMATLKSLKLYGMAQSIKELAAQSSPAYQQAEPIFNVLLKAEVAELEVRSINYQMKIAAFSPIVIWTGFDFTQSCVDGSLV